MGRRDRHNAGRSALIPHRPDESAKDRHARRLRENLANVGAVGSFCAARGIAFSIHNRGHHWKFERLGRVAEWWPSSGKFVRDKNWDDALHAHDWEQAIAALNEFFKQFLAK